MQNKENRKIVRKIIDLVIGKTYIIDADFSNGGPIELMKIYGKHFCRVKDPDTGTEWDTMIYRLSEQNTNHD